MLQKQIKEAIIVSMKEKNSEKTNVLRMLVSAFTNELVAQGKKPQDELSDDEVQTVINRVAKQRKDSILQFEQAGRLDLAEEEKSQLSYMEEYLPKLMSEDEVRAYIAEKISNGLDITQKGLVMKELMVELKGKVDGLLVKKIIDTL